MKVYSLLHENHDFLGLEDNGEIIDLTKAIALFELSRSNRYDEPVESIEELILDDLFTVDYLGDVMAFVSGHGLLGDLTVTGDYIINQPLYPGKIIALGNNYRRHIEEMNQKLPEKPVLFGK